MKYKRNEVAAIVDAPIVSTEGVEDAGDVLLNFYRALGWNGTDNFDVRKVRTTEAVYNRLLEAIKEIYPNNDGAAALMVHAGPGVDDDVPPNKVRLLKGWTIPEELIAPRADCGLLRKSPTS